ncbi:MAG: hypothetical protein IJ708_07580, partial [Clostridia bacterium]|nr:hypothetical protein [Clostridia bacterium]
MNDGDAMDEAWSLYSSDHIETAPVDTTGAVIGLTRYAALCKPAPEAGFFLYLVADGFLLC